jgi:hypothetical protein
MLNARAKRRRSRPLELNVSKAIGPPPQIVPKKLSAALLWQGGEWRCRRPTWHCCLRYCGHVLRSLSQSAAKLGIQMVPVKQPVRKIYY